MTQFSSRPPYNDDPMPRVTVATGGRHRNHPPTMDDATACRIDPRPEFDRPQNNPTNPILVARRNNPGENIYYKNLDRWPTEAEINHARKVLTRRANLSKVES